MALMDTMQHWTSIQQPGQTIEQCKMESAKTKRQVLDEADHLHKIMLSKKKEFLLLYKQRAIKEAKDKAILLKKRKRFKTLIIAWSCISRLYATFRKEYQEFVVFRKRRLVVVKLMSKLRMQLKLKCRHPELRASKKLFPVIKPEHVDWLNYDRLRYAFNFLGRMHSKPKELKASEIVMDFLKTSKDKR